MQPALVSGAVGKSLRRWAPPLTAVFAVAGVVVTAGSDPGRAGNHFPRCPFKALTGWDCPGCGSTRMLHELLHGHLLAAAHYNLLALLAVPYLLYAYLSWTGRVYRWRRWRLPAWQPRTGQILGLLAVVVAWGVLRNLPIGPLRALHV